MKRSARNLLLLVLMLTSLMGLRAQAQWVTSGSTRVYVSDGQTCESVYYKKKKLGFVKIGSYWYCRTKKDKAKTGWVKVGGKTYYFVKKTGRMVRGKVKKISKKYYCFNAEGVMQKSKWINDRYYDAKGVQLRSTTRVIGGITYTFTATGAAYAKTASGVSVERQYYNDPSVTQETLLAAIIYCEAGNQPYYGQLAVGLVITNRVRNASYPNSIKEVIYAAQQFEPARTGVLTYYLKNTDKITQSCKTAARQVLNMYSKNTYKIAGPGSKTVSLKGYYFFMTPAAYKRLGLTSKYLKLKDHYFFKTWEKASTSASSTTSDAN